MARIVQAGFLTIEARLQAAAVCLAQQEGLLPKLVNQFCAQAFSALRAVDFARSEGLFENGLHQAAFVCFGMIELRRRLTVTPLDFEYNEFQGKYRI
jgi:hypothetical protein